MDATDHGGIVRLRPEHAAAGLALSAEAHWNQTEDDWLVFLTQGTVYGIRSNAGGLVATAALLPYEDGNAWISMVLVTAGFQRRGLATQLLETCLETAARESLTTWLDATAAGTAVYGPLGFTPSIHLLRLRFEGEPKSSSGSPLLMGSVVDLIARDRRAMGFDRSLLLGALAGRAGSRVAAQDGAICLIRDGRTARHIGPLFAGQSTAATALIESVVRSEPGPFLLDVTGEQQPMIEQLIADGWAVERSFQRMRFGRVRTPSVEIPFASAGPEYG